MSAAWQFEPPLVGITILVNLGYSILAVYVLARIYNSENVLFSDGFAGFKLFQKRSEIKKGTIPAPGDLLVSVTVLLLLLLYAGSAVSVRFGFWGTMVSQLLIFAVPLFMVWYLKSDVRTLFSLRHAGGRGGDSVPRISVRKPAGARERSKSGPDLGGRVCGVSYESGEADPYVYARGGFRLYPV